MELIVEEKDLYGDFGNSILYRMCEENAGHTDINVVHGKLWLIGRAYAAAIERKAKTPFPAKHAAQNLIESDIDEKIGEIAKIEWVDLSNIVKVLDAHSYLTQRFKSVTGLANRSLASKYLHFHARKAVFICDSISAARLSKELKSSQCRKSIAIPSGYDDTYAAFAIRCLYYRDHILKARSNKKIDPRELDKWLYRP